MSSVFDLHLLAALGAAACWAVAGFVSAQPAKQLGAIAFNRLRLAIVFSLLSLYALMFGGWSSLDSSEFWVLLLSGAVGVFLGDTALFLTLNRMGPRRTAVLFSANAPMATVLGFLFLGESLSVQSVLGVVLTLIGVVVAVVFGKRRSQLHHWEAVQGNLGFGVMLGLLAALLQALGSLVARPVMLGDVDPVAASAIRVGIGAMGLSVLMALPWAAVKPQAHISVRLVLLVTLTGVIGMAIGMTLLLFALKGGEVGLVSSLSSVSPVFQLPLIWWLTRERPAFAAWLGAAMVVVGVALIFMV